MRVGIIAVSVKTGGSERRLARLVEHLARQGRDSYYLVAPERLLRSLDQHGVLATHARGAGTPLELHSMGPDPGGEHLERLRGTFYTGFLAWRRLLGVALAEAAKAGPTDVVHYLTPESYLMAPAPYRRHAVIEAVSAAGGWRVEHMLRRAAEHGALVNCLSRSIQHSLARGMAPDVVRRLHVSPGSMVGVPAPAPAPKGRRVALLGPLEPRRNPLLFVEALGIVAARRRDFRASIGVRGSMRGAVAARVQALGLEGLVDWNEDVLPGASLASAQIAVSLQATDNYATQSVLEAMQCRAAIIASDVGSTHRLVNPDTGLLVPLEASAIAAALETLLADEERTRAMGEAASELVRTQHRLESYAEYMERLYRTARVMGGAA